MSVKYFFLLLFTGSFFFLSNAQAFTVGPSKQTLIIDPGTEQTAQLFILNTSDSTKEYIPLVDSFGKHPETGEIQLSIPEPAKRWVRVEPSSLQLSAGERGIFHFKITAPESATPGAHYLGFFAQELSPKGQVSISANAGSLGYIYVSGDIQETLQIEQFETKKFISLNGENTISIGIKNTGNIHNQPKGFIQLQKDSGEEIFRKQVFSQTTLLANDQHFVSIPVNLSSLKHIGKVRATIVIQYGFSDQFLTEEISFWYLPWWFLLGLTGIIIVLFSFLIRRWLNSGTQSSNRKQSLL